MINKQLVKQVSGAEEYRDVNERIYLMNQIGTILN